MGTVAGERPADDGIGTTRLPEGVGRTGLRRRDGRATGAITSTVPSVSGIGTVAAITARGPIASSDAVKPRISRPVGVAWTPAWHAESTTTFGGGSMRSRS